MRLYCSHYRRYREVEECTQYGTRESGYYTCYTRCGVDMSSWCSDTCPSYETYCMSSRTVIEPYDVTVAVDKVVEEIVVVESTRYARSCPPGGQACQCGQDACVLVSKCSVRCGVQNSFMQNQGPIHSNSFG